MKATASLVSERQKRQAGHGLRLLFVSEELPPVTGWGGIGTYTWVLGRALVQRGHHVTIVARGWGADTDDDKVEGMRILRLTVPEPSWRRGTVRLTQVLWESRGMQLWARRVGSAVRRLHRETAFDLAEAPEYHAQALLLPTDLPIVVRLHTPAFVNRLVSGVRVGGSRFDTALAEGAERVAVRRAELVTAPTAEMLSRARSHWGGLERAEVVANPLDVESFEPTVEPHGPPTILHVGRVSRRKGVEDLVEAYAKVMRHVPDARLRFVGKDHPSAPGGSSMVTHLRNRLTALGVAHDRVRFDGHVDRRDLPAAYRDATVCVVPSLYESFGYTCVEAMASARCLVATAVGGIPEVVTHGVDGVLVPPADPHRLSAMLVELLRDPQQRLRMAANGRRKALERFGGDRVAARMEHIYRGVIAEVRR